MFHFLPPNFPTPGLKNYYPSFGPVKRILKRRLIKRAPSSCGRPCVSAENCSKGCRVRGRNRCSVSFCWAEFPISSNHATCFGYWTLWPFMPKSCPLQLSARRLGSAWEAPARQIRVKVDDFVKSPSAALRFIFRHCDVLLCTPHSSRFARLASGAFYCAVSFNDFLRGHQG